MVRSPLVLAALSTVAVPGLDAIDVRRSPHPGVGMDAAVVVGTDGQRWVVRAPQDAATGAALEAEVALLQALATQVDVGALPFDVPRPAGAVSLEEGGRAIVSRQLPGRAIRLEKLGPGPGLAAALGRAIAAIHELPVSVVEDAGLPVYEADEYRRRRLAELDEAARTGYVPAFLLRRWERALEDVALWRFQPTVVHGDLSSEHVLCEGDSPVGILGWSEAKVADPADDLAWLLVAAPQPAVDPIVEAYHLRRTELRDPHLPTRALLAGELAVARWLLHGVHTDDGAVIDDARSMLDELEVHLTRYEEAARAAVASAPVDGPDEQTAPDEVEDAPVWREMTAEHGPLVQDEHYGTVAEAAAELNGAGGDGFDDEEYGADPRPWG
ncbi:phosphotransferase [Actinotalea sp. M2MS4P-6]|uniref:phosphotransferase n=1 Tax=Actinotalea sp. M2MS4P-6 TaxID=2983762 RepID=UPI0021E44A0E|nr:phosphotransferase [Actinotalea sp. M2MS4P-6]MCV2396531.1 phosphotransferase [Actinotalea sp. M2MS4P-6]